MIMHMAIHHPEPGKAGDLVEALRQHEQQIRTQPGVLSVHTLKDAHSGAVVALAVYATKESWLAAQPGLARLESGEEFSGWESAPPTIYHLEEI